MVTLVVDHAAKRAASHEPHECVSAAATAEPSAERVAMPPITVNGVAISRKAIAAEVQNFPAKNPGEAWRGAARALVVRELLLQEAARLGVSIEQKADEDGRLETEEDALVRALLDQEVHIPRADDDMLRRYYDNNRSRFVTPALFEADHILFAASRDDRESFAAALDKASALAEILSKDGGRFEALAREYSACPSASVGGSLGQVGVGDTTAEFEAALNRLTEGEISGPVETRYGVHLIRMRRRIAGKQLPFEMVRERIAAYLDDHVRRHAAAQYLTLLAGRANIQGIVFDGTNSPLVQ